MVLLREALDGRIYKHQNLRIPEDTPNNQPLLEMALLLSVYMQLVTATVVRVRPER